MSGRILIADGVATNRIVIKVALSEGCYQIAQAENGTSVLTQINRDAPDLIILDMRLPGVDGLTLCARLKHDPTTADIPIIITAGAQDGDTRLSALQAGADEVLLKPFDEMLLMSRVRSLLRARETAQELALREGTRALGFAETPLSAPAGQVALISDMPRTGRMWRAALEPEIAAQTRPMTRAEALALRPGGAIPDLFVIAADLVQSGDGLRLITELRARSVTRHAAVLIAVSAEAREDAVMALDLGANDLLTLPLEGAEASLRIRTQLRRKQQADRLRTSVRDGLRLAITDPLTGLYNRRYAMPLLARMSEAAALRRAPMAVMLADIDRFKSVNDRFGHPAGDLVLSEVARRLTADLRPQDLSARIGGEEFLIALPDCAPYVARNAAEWLRQRVGETPIALPDGMGTLQVSVSIGMALFDGQTPLPKEMLNIADQALYHAKAQGRNMVTVSRAAA